MWAEKPSKRPCGAVVSNVLTLDGSKLLPVCICFVNFYDVVDGSMLRCTGSGIGSVSLFVRNVLTSDGSKLFPVCIYLFNFYHAVDRFWLRCSGSGIVSASLIVSNKLTLDGSKLFSVCICFFYLIDVGMICCCVAQAVALDLCRCLSATC